MTAYYGVRCKTTRTNPLAGGGPCKTVFIFDITTDTSSNQIEFPCPPLGGLECPICRQTHLYSSDDVLEIALFDPE